MADKTYIELNKNDVDTIQLSMWRKTTGNPYSPSGAFYTVKGAAKDNTIISRTQTGQNSNTISADITTTVTSSAAEYDIHWEIYKNNGGIKNHYTKLLVLDV